MHDRKEGKHGEHEQEERLPRLLGQSDHDREDKQEPHREPSRHPDAKGEQDDAESDPRGPERLDETSSQHAGATGLGEEFTKDHPEHDDGPGAGERITKPRLEQPQGVENRHRFPERGGRRRRDEHRGTPAHGHRAQRDGADQQRDERVQLQPGD